MGKKKKCHEMLSFGGRLRFYREETGLTQAELAKRIGTTRQTVAGWESNDRANYARFLDGICETLGIEKTALVTGVSKDHQTVASQLNLQDSAINFLMSLRGNRFVYFVDTDDDPNEAEQISDMFYNRGDRYIPLDIEGARADEMRAIINLLLSCPNGKMLLAMIFQYLTIDFESASIDGKQIYELEYKENGKTKVLPVSLMRYALGQGILDKLHDLRNEEGWLL